MDPFDESGLIHGEDFDYSFDETSIIYDHDGPQDSLDRVGIFFFQILWGPINILTDYRSIILITLMTRIIHILIDCASSSSSKVLFKNIATTLMGLYQINFYLGRICQESCPSVRTQLFLIPIWILLFYWTCRTRNVFLRALSVMSTLSPVVYNEYNIFYGAGYQHCFLRNTMMTMTMKLSSVISESSDVMSFQSLIAYLLHPASLIVGIWHSHKQVREAKSTKSAFVSLSVRISKDFVKAIALLVVSTSLSEVIEYLKEISSIALWNLKVPLLVYLVALDFRLTHYFACHLAASLLGMFPEYQQLGEPVKTCDIVRVELPRSLVDVVTMWNIPMHRWLKETVFQPTLRTTRSIELAILITYLVSSLLHGLKFHIWAVLLTLGLLTFAEHKLRTKLANRLSACIEAQPCRYVNDGGLHDTKCARRHSLTPRNSHKVKIINFAFRVVAMAHLAYLGSVFVGNTDQAGYADVLKIWSSLYYFGHILGLLTLIICTSCHG